MARRKLLFIGHTGIWDTPLFGAQLRSANLAQQLSRTFDVTYACPSDIERAGNRPDLAERSGFAKVLIAPGAAPVGQARWGGIGTSIRLLTSHPVPLDIEERVPRQLVLQLAEERSGAQYDVVWAHRSWHAEAAKRAGFDRVICDIDDFEHVIFRQQVAELGHYLRKPLHLLAIAKLRRYERKLTKRFSRVVITKAEDAALLDATGASSHCVVPNGITIAASSPVAHEGGPCFLFVGILGYGPNVDAASWFAKKAFPLIRQRVPSARFIIAGRAPCPPELSQLCQQPGIEIIESPPDLVALYQKAWVVVTPIRLGHGTRIKVLEALAHARALVTTSEAARGHHLVDGRDAFIADSVEIFAARCLELVADPALRNQLAMAGLNFVKANATWDRVGERATTVVDSLIPQ
jgi:glycosyltransferase involved in cell wall biosynthesis